MKNQRRFPLISGALLCAAPVQAATEEPVLPRVGPWHVDYVQNRCELYAAFGKGDDLTTAGLTRVAPGDEFSLWLVGQKFASPAVVNTSVVTFAPVGQPQTVQSVHGHAGTVPMLRIGHLRLDGRVPRGSEDLPPVEPSVEARVDRLVVRRADRTVVLDLRGLDKAMAALRSCTDDLVRGWGYDPVVQAALTKRASPRGSPYRWLTSSDYPASALSRGESALLQVRVDIAATGAVRGCQVLDQSAGKQFAEITCKAIQRRGRFSPAADAQGYAVDSFWIGSWIWMIA